MRRILLLVMVAGLILAMWSQTGRPASAGGPDHDDFANARVVDSIPYKDSDDISAATHPTNDPTLPEDCATTKGYVDSVWYTFNPGQTGIYELSTSGSTYETALAVFTGTKGALTLVGCPAFVSGAGNSFLKIALSQGVKYSILVGRFFKDTGGGNALQFTIDRQVPAGQAFKCYLALSFRLVDEQVQLIDQFGGKESTVLRANGLCNPAVKDGEFADGGTALVCYNVAQPPAQVGQVEVFNQFGGQVLRLTETQRLCVGSEKNADQITGTIIANLPSFKCYQASLAPGSTFARQQVSLSDQYGSKSAFVLRPNALCTTVQKVDGAAGTGSADVLVCYQMLQFGFDGFRIESIANQFTSFEPQWLLVLWAQSLCVPTDKIELD